MKTTDKAIAIIKRFEGVRNKPYRCPANLWTIGVGHVMYPNQVKLPLEDRMTIPLKPEDDRTFTPEEIDAILRRDLDRFEQGVNKLVTANLTQGMFDGLVSFSFNLGLGTLQRSTLRQKINRNQTQAAAKEFLKYSKAGGKVLKGLRLRRQAEQALFLS